MGAPVRKAATYADLEAVPAPLVAEIVHGVLETHPRPLPRHAIAQAELARVVGTPFRQGGGPPGDWIFMIEPELHLGAHVVVPDIAGWRRERLPTLPSGVGVTTAPDWICEILSPSTARLDLGPKRRIYAEAGVGHLWLLDPAIQVLDAFSLAGDRWLLAGTAVGSEPVSLPPFDAISFPLDSLFPLDPPVTDKA
jgi:Uma2 family endonuclease